MSHRLLLIGAAFLSAGLPSAAAAQSVPAIQAAERGVRSPVAFVRARFAQYERGEAPTSWPEHSYSPRLAGLFAALDAAEGGEERIDFDWWIDGQDWQIDQVRLRPAWPGPGRMNVHARWRNFGSEQNSTFLFVRQNGRWLLDDVVSHTSGWTLSILLEQAARS